MKILPLKNYIYAKRTHTNENGSNEFVELEIITSSYNVPGRENYDDYFKDGQTIYVLNKNVLLFEINKAGEGEFDIYLVKCDDVLAVEVEDIPDDEMSF